MRATKQSFVLPSRRLEKDGLPVTINAAFFHEIKEDNWELTRLLKALKRLLDNPLRLQRRCLLVTLLRGLRDQLARHFSLEETYGYFHGPLVVAPELSDLAETLQAEHATLNTQIAEILEHAEYVAHDTACKSLWSQVSQRVRAFCDQLQEHESREIELILRAYTDELGVAD